MAWRFAHEGNWTKPRAVLTCPDGRTQTTSNEFFKLIGR